MSKKKSWFEKEHKIIGKDILSHIFGIELFALCALLLIGSAKVLTLEPTKVIAVEEMFKYMFGMQTLTMACIFFMFLYMHYGIHYNEKSKDKLHKHLGVK